MKSKAQVKKCYTQVHHFLKFCVTFYSAIDNNLIVFLRFYIQTSNLVNKEDILENRIKTYTSYWANKNLTSWLQ